MKLRGVRPSLAELRAVADKLLLWFSEVKNGTDAGGSVAILSDDHETLRAIALSSYGTRRARKRQFPKQLFGEPAWDMLLDLYINQKGQRAVSVSSLCIASMVPATTALRYISMLEQNGLLKKTPAEHDRRLSLVELTDEGYEAMEEYLRSVADVVVDLLAVRREREES